MAQVLYRKYRSKNLSEIVGQDHITKTLTQALKSDRISHAYLFTGPRGVGKTSVARILAHEVNGLAYTDDKPHIDIIEIDAASNRRIDEIRDLREKVHTLPSSAKYKVYIIDEVHMLTNEAFNALLKTLEEPPAHVIFILATTNPNKLPETIISRTQRFSFKPIDNLSAVSHLKEIAKKEKIKINDQALRLIAEHGDGSFRDSISLLDQMGSSGQEVTEEDITRVLGIPPSAAIDKLVYMIDSQNGTYREVSEELKELIDQGFSSQLLAKRLMNDLRDKLIDGSLNLEPSKTIEILKDLLDINGAADPNSYLLLTLIKALPKPRETESLLSKETGPEITKKESPTKKVAAAVSTTHQKSAKPVVSEEIWPQILNELKNRYNTLYGIVRMAQPVFKDNNRLDLIFDFPFHKKKVAEAKNKQLISNIILELTDQDFVINCYLNNSGQDLKRSDLGLPEKPESKDLETINKIFGGGELVDS